jgi:nucleoid-associated protein YgaU
VALEKALIVNDVTGERIPVLFNPEEYTLNKENNYAQAAVPGLSAPLLQFVHGNLQTLEMELLVDSYEEHQAGDRKLNQAGEDVRNLTGKITNLLAIDASIHAPPPLIFSWGSLTFRCVLAKVSQRFIMFRPDGIPLRARLQVKFNEFTNADFEAKEVKRETVDYSSLYVVGQGETLSGIAGRVYQNPTLWRPIALRNAIDNPKLLSVGMELLIPRLPYQHPETGEVMA